MNENTKAKVLYGFEKLAARCPWLRRVQGSIRDRTEFFRSASAVSRRLLAWTVRHKYPVIIAVLLLYVMFWPKTVPPQRVVAAEPDSQPSSAATTPSMQPAQTATGPSTQPADQPVQRFAGQIPLFVPDAQRADAKWSLPTELKASELQDFAQQVNRLSNDVSTLADLEKQCAEGMQKLFDDKMRGVFWARVIGRGFHDPQLPLDWYEMVKEQNSVASQAFWFTDDFLSFGVQRIIDSRLDSIRVRVVGGQVLIGDVLFVKAAQAHVNRRRPYFEVLRPRVNDVVGRASVEFEAELKPPQ